MKIRSAEFLLSAVALRGFPPPVLPEVAFAGKSNVGKSSLINALLGRRNLVKTSSTPGKTQALNFFLINEAYRFVDLPGYGFAKVPQSVRQGWEALITGYLQDRDCLRGVVVILDARHDPTELDRRFKAWLDEAAVPPLYVANKVDKLKRAQLKPRLSSIADALNLDAPPLACSAQDGTGRPQLWKQIDAWVREPVRRRSAS